MRVLSNEIGDILRSIERKFQLIRSATSSNSSYPQMDEDIEFVLECATSKQTDIRHIGSDKIVELAEFSIDIRNRLLNVMKTGKAHQKFAIAAHQHIERISGKNNTYKDFQDFVKEIISLAISDKSKTIWRIQCFCLSVL